jgi:hypothetical protein
VSRFSKTDGSSSHDTSPNLEVTSSTGWLAGGTEEVESAIYKQSLLASGLKQARGKEGIKISHPP